MAKTGKTITDIEVKSGRHQMTLPGMETFAATFEPKRVLLVGGDGIPLKEFLSKPVEHWI